MVNGNTPIKDPMLPAATAAGSISLGRHRTRQCDATTTGITHLVRYLLPVILSHCRAAYHFRHSVLLPMRPLGSYCRGSRACRALARRVGGFIPAEAHARLGTGSVSCDGGSHRPTKP